MFHEKKHNGPIILNYLNVKKVLFKYPRAFTINLCQSFFLLVGFEPKKLSVGRYRATIVQPQVS